MLCTTQKSLCFSGELSNKGSAFILHVMSAFTANNYLSRVWTSLVCGRRSIVEDINSFAWRARSSCLEVLPAGTPASQSGPKCLRASEHFIPKLGIFRSRMRNSYTEKSPYCIFNFARSQARRVGKRATILKPLMPTHKHLNY